MDHGSAGFKRESDDLARHRQRGAELTGLKDGALGEFAAGDPGGEAKIVLDPHAASGLAATRRPVNFPEVRSSCRRAMNAWKMISARSGCALRISRSAG